MQWGEVRVAILAPDVHLEKLQSIPYPALFSLQTCTCPPTFLNYSSGRNSSRSSKRQLSLREGKPGALDNPDTGNALSPTRFGPGEPSQVLIAGIISSWNPGKVMNPIQRCRRRAKDRTGDTLHHRYEGSGRTGTLWAGPSPPRSRARDRHTYSRTQTGTGGPGLSLKSTSECMAVGGGPTWGCSRQFRPFSGLRIPTLVFFALESWNCSKMCQDINIVHMVPGLASPATVRSTVGPNTWHVTTSMIVTESTKIAAFPGSRFKATQDGRKGLCHRKVWIKILRLVWC